MRLCRLDQLKPRGETRGGGGRDGLLRLVFIVYLFSLCCCENVLTHHTAHVLCIICLYATLVGQRLHSSVKQFGCAFRKQIRKYDDAYKLQFLTRDQPREPEMNVLSLLGIISPHSNGTIWADN